MSTPELAPFMALAQETMRRCYAEEDPISLQQWLTEQIARLAGASNDDNAVMTWEESFDYYEALLDRRERDAALPEAERQILNWPWASWNNMIDPLEPGLLAVIGAGDGMGKTIYAESIAEWWAQRRSKVVFLHYELNRDLVLDRRTSRHTSMTRRMLKSGQLTPEQRRLITDTKPRLLAWDGCITYVHTPGWTMERTVQRLHSLKAEGKCDVVVLDYLEKNAASRRQTQMFGNSFNQREADNVEQIKNFAEATETPVLMLTQLSKAGKRTDFDQLDRTDMRGAGEKTEKANVVILLHREKADDGEKGYSNLINVRVDKNTVGGTGTFRQFMEPEYFRVADLHKPNFPS